MGDAGVLGLEANREALLGSDVPWGRVAERGLTVTARDLADLAEEVEGATYRALSGGSTLAIWLAEHCPLRTLSSVKP